MYTMPDFFRRESVKIAICDDEKAYCDYLKETVAFYCQEKQIDFSCLTFRSGEALLCCAQNFDIVFLDIEMDGRNGIEIAKEINRKSRSTVIFVVTAYQKYLDDAMDLDVFRYIDKPINQKRIYAGLDKAMEFLNQNRLPFRTRDDGIVTVRKSDIIYVEVRTKNVYVVTKEQKYLAREKMDYFKAALSATDFAVPHHSYIVNLNYIVQFQRNRLQLQDGTVVSIAPKKQSALKKKFIRFIGEDNGSLSDNF